MMTLALAAAVILAFLALPVLTVRFPKAFLLYLFVFIPLYLFCLDRYIRLFRPAVVSDSIRIVKDLAWVCVLASFVLWLLLKKGGGVHLPKRVAVPFLVFLLFMCVQWVRGYFALGPFGAALAMRNTLGYIPVVFIAPLIIKSREDLFLIARCFTFVMVAAGLYAVVQFVFRMPSAHYILTPREGLKTNISSFFAAYNVLGWFSAMSFPFILLFHKFSRRKSLSFVALGLCGFSVMVSQSRTGLIAFVFALLCLCFLRILQTRKIVIPIILIIIVLVICRPEIITKHRMAGGVLGDARFTMVWPSLWKFFLEKPFFGHGLGVFGTAGHTFLGRQGIASNFLVDNFYFTILLNMGLFGLMLFFVFIGSACAYSLRLARKMTDGFVRNCVLAIAVSIIVNLIYAIPANFIESFPESVYFWFLVGTLCAVRSIECREGGSCCPQAS